MPCGYLLHLLIFLLFTVYLIRVLIIKIEIFLLNIRYLYFIILISNANDCCYTTIIIIFITSIIVMLTGLIVILLCRPSNCIGAEYSIGIYVLYWSSIKFIVRNYLL